MKDRRGSESARRPPITFAHRGASAYAPENTIAAFTLALSLGATGVESDVWLAADGVPVLHHDRTIRRDGGRVDVTRQTSQRLAAFDVPTLDALYAAIGSNVDVSLDLEHEAVVVPTLEVAERRGATERLWCCSPDLGPLTLLRSRSAAVRLVCSTRPHRVEEGVPALAARLADSAVDALNMHWRDWTPQLVEVVRALGLLVFAWDAQTEAAISRTLGLGVDALYSDWPDRLAAAIGPGAPPGPRI